jgi:hypothetical protein
MKIKRRGASLDRLSAAAMLVLSTLLMGELLSVDVLDRHLRLALSSFAVAVPCLAGTVYALEAAFSTDADRIVMTWYLGLLVYVGYGASLVGVGAVFWHFDPSFGRLFVVASIAVCVAGGAYLGKLNEEEA